MRNGTYVPRKIIIMSPSLESTLLENGTQYRLNICPLLQIRVK